MPGADEKFLQRWSRRKVAAAQPAAPTPARDVPIAGNASPPEPLPPADSLNFDSDFRAYMHAKVEDSVKRAALKKLFADPRFNVMDGLDVYIDDYSKDDPIPQAMLEQLEHAKATLSGGRPPVDAEATGEGAVAARAAEPGAGKPDTAAAPEDARADDAQSAAGPVAGAPHDAPEKDA